MPHEMQNEGSADSTTGVYTIDAIYERKQYKVAYETNYRGKDVIKIRSNGLLPSSNPT
ncbi:hypothetical protein [Anseongella ginsenosidimutans]|uniref:hypothetical protein n=1 Tax=Anseongella ginsenosidimutans TaxID=496056 RepID=UPI0013159CD9|nr:hypothetical protein [Anseongella ginsenosidimutans]